MRPTSYGYLRIVSDDAGGDEVAQIRCELAKYAKREGLALNQVFTEGVRCPRSAFEVMLEALKRNDVRNVIVPSLWHFARLPGLQDAMRQHIEQETGARLWVVQGAWR